MITGGWDGPSDFKHGRRGHCRAKAENRRALHNWTFGAHLFLACVGCAVPARGSVVCVRRTHLDEHNEAQRAVVVGVQRCGSKSSMRLARWVGSRSRMSFK